MKNGLLKKLALLLTGVMVFSAAACGTEAEQKSSNTLESSNVVESLGSSTATENESEHEVVDYADVEFRIGWWGGDARHNSTIEFIEVFEKDYKNLNIDVEYTGWGDYWTKLSTQAAGGELPDIIQMDYSYINQYAEAGLLMPLDEYVTDGMLDLSDVSENSYSSGVVNGELLAVPCGVNTFTYAYSVDIANEAGVTLSDTPTWDELTDAMRTVYEKTGAQGRIMKGIDIYARTYGENYIGEDGKSVGISVDTLCSYWQRFHDGYEEGWLWNAVDTPIDSTGAALKNKTIWLDYGQTNAVGKWLEESGMELKFISLPVVEEGIQPGFSKPSMFWAITSECENPELAVEFINYYINDVRVYEIAGFERAVPISNAIREELADSMTKAETMQVEFITWMEDGHSSAIFPPTPAKWNEAVVLITETSDLMDYHELAPEDHERLATEGIAYANEVLSAAE